jgi:hypothetical protein
VRNNNRKIKDKTMSEQKYSMEDIQDLFKILKHSQSHSYEKGKKYFVRTVTMAYVGRLREMTDTDMVMEECSWIPDTGKYHEFLLRGDPTEVEPYPQDIPVLINRFSVIDASEWKHNLFSKPKSS